ncbi:MAG: 4-hydroxythreonine-4-phosphate dehydrogenase PdxA [Candidatus Omnitrophica bacterium]|nr:4-hydroxythreonine-4-phosphate dehydrogenase PdxA [Candidatus Omnitrophota bacterium]
MSKKRVVIASGDPAGCGPLITLKAIEQLKNKDIDFFVTGDNKIFEQFPVYKRVKKRINFIDLNTPGIKKLKKGKPSISSGRAALSYLNEALELVDSKDIRRLVTAPLSKEAVQLIYRQFSGHTEYLKNYFRVPQIEMMMVSAQLKIVLLTRHIDLSKVNSLLRPEEIKKTLSLVYSSLQGQFKLKKPNIAFASFNPHAGVDTFFGKEEKKIAFGIAKFRKKISGPYPSDTLFTKDSLNKYDCIVCVYHDQAMIPFKLLAMREGVNLTLGLPIVRTSPAHGVAYDLTKQKKTPFHSSMFEAIKLALKLTP